MTSLAPSATLRRIVAVSARDLLEWNGAYEKCKGPLPGNPHESRDAAVTGAPSLPQALLSKLESLRLAGKGAE